MTDIHDKILDKDDDGKLSELEIMHAQKILEIENEDKRQDAQRNMAWFSLFGMVLYPIAIIASSYFKLDSAANILGNMAGTYFVSVAAIVAAFYGKEAFTASMNSKTGESSASVISSKPVPKVSVKIPEKNNEL